MLKLLHEEDFPKAFNVSPEEKKLLIELISGLHETKKEPKLSWAVERLWIDERFSDNLRAMAIFMLGYAYALQDERRTKWKKLF